jgi:hypothetical protein
MVDTLSGSIDSTETPDVSSTRPHLDRKELENRILGKSIATARKSGILSEQEAQFLLDEYVKEFQSNVHSRSEKRLLFATE